MSIASSSSPTALISEEQREKRRVTLASILGATVITVLKLIVGLLTGSLGILAEALHSGFDLVAAGVTYVSVRVSDKPADADHQFGHYKFENFSAFVETVLLLLTCVWIIFEAVKRLYHPNVEIEPTIWAFLVMGLSIVVDYGRSRSLMRVARKYESQAIEADALHFSTDIYSSAVVILGLALVWAARQFQVPGLIVADAIAALGVSAIVIFISMKLGRRTLDALMDAAPRGVCEDVARGVEDVRGVMRCERVRVRRAGNRYFVDIIINVDRSLSLQQVKAISDRVEERIQEILPRSDIMIHSQPNEPAHSSMFDKVKAVAARHNLAVHDLAAHDIAGSHHLELHLEVSDKLTLREAHDLVSRMEGDILAEVPEISVINTHIENAGEEVERGLRQPREQERIEARLREIVAHFPEIQDIHDILVRSVRGRIYVSCHCTLDGNLPVARVHEVTADLEAQFKRSFPNVYRVTIHSEPAAQ